MDDSASLKAPSTPPQSGLATKPLNRQEPTPAFNRSYVKPRADLLEFIPPEARRVLDVGCATGALGNALKERNANCRVVGIEFDRAMADVATHVLDEVHCADLNKAIPSELCGGQKFDVIVFGDVLEHLVNPWGVLTDAVTLLDDDGHVVTSIPNVSHISTFIAVFLLGRWPYNARGIHDRTHLRWFTRQNILELLACSGLHPVREWRKLRFTESRERFRGLNKLARYFNLPLLSHFLTFQYLHLSQFASHGSPNSKSPDKLGSGSTVQHGSVAAKGRNE